MRGAKQGGLQAPGGVGCKMMPKDQNQPENK